MVVGPAYSWRLTNTNLVSQAHNEYVMAEKKREEWELKNHREGEILEMVEIFEVWVGGKSRFAWVVFQ